MLRFDGKVVLITGAANGLGKEYALAFGARGATVIVNDLGSSSSGEGSSTRPADLVVDEIIKAGGKAVANYDSVEEGEKIIKFIIDKFKRIDVIVHNAGILRDKSLAKMKESDWDLIHRIHLRSVFLITKAAWPHMAKQKFGRIITIASSAGIYGNFGQCNYSAAKMGVYAFSQCLALEGKKYNIRSNCVAPIAGSRLTRFIMPDEMADALKARYVAPLMLWLSHEECGETGGLFECGAGWMGKLRWERTDGQVVRKQDDDHMTAEDVRDNWSKICDFSKSHHPVNIHDANTRYFNTIERFDKSKGTASFEDVYCVFPKDLILYALGVGVKTSHNGSSKYLYENSTTFDSLPTFSVIPSNNAIHSLSGSIDIKGKKIDYTQLLHGEQYTQVFKPLPTEGKLKVKAEVAGMMDKGTAAIVVINVMLYNVNDEKLALNQSVLFVKGAGGFGGPRSCEALVPTRPVPSRKPDFTVQEKTFEDQAALYRLSGDSNPLHIDPEFAKLAGFERPILHGLCTYAIACRHVMSRFCPLQPSLIKAIKARFSSEVLPGQTIVTDMWKEGERVHFECKVLETGKTCLSSGYVDLQAHVMAQQSKL